MKAPNGETRFDYIMSMMKDVKQWPADTIEMYSKFYREFQENDFDLDTDKKNSIGHQNKPTLLWKYDDISFSRY
jgi:hypothetical protein